MNISNFKITDLTNMATAKIATLTNTSDINKIDFSNLTSFIITTFIVIFTSSVILWLLKSIALYTMARRKKDEYAFLAFIPYFCLFTKGRIVGDTKIFGIDIKHTEYLLPALIIACMLPFTRHISFILLMLFSLAILYKIYQIYIPNMAIALFILTIIFPILEPFILFFIRNKSDYNKQE